MRLSTKTMIFSLSLMTPAFTGGGAANAADIFVNCTQAPNVQLCIADAQSRCPKNSPIQIRIVIDIPGTTPDVLIHSCVSTLSGGVTLERNIGTLPVDSDGTGTGGGGSGGGGNPVPIPMVSMDFLEECHPHFRAINPLTGRLECGWGWPP